jgi:hypothetical protein
MEITNYREANPSDKHLALFDIELANGMILHNWKVLRGKKGGYFAVSPSFGVDDGFGQRKFFPYISFTKEKGEEFSKRIHELLKPLVRL